MDIFVCEWCGFIDEKKLQEYAIDLCPCCSMFHEGMDENQLE